VPIKILADCVQLLGDIDISGCVCNEYRLLHVQVLLQQQARSTPFFQKGFLFFNCIYVLEDRKLIYLL